MIGDRTVQSQQFAAVHAGRIARVPEWKTWMVAPGGRWERDREEAIIRRWIAEWLQERGQAANPTAIEALLRCLPSVPGVMSSPEEWDANPYLFGWANGVWDLRTCQNLGFDPSHRVTLYSAYAPDFETKCPAFLGQFRWLCGDEAAVGYYLRAFLGYCLTGLQRENLLLVCQGEGGCGKSVFWGALVEIMGPYAGIAALGLLVRDRRLHSPEEYALADLWGKRLLYHPEVPRGGSLNEDLLKWITGEGRVKGRNPCERHFDITSTCKPVITGNYWPQFQSLDRSMRRRLVGWEIKASLPDEQRDKDLGERMKDEGHAIAGQLMCWAHQYCKEGMPPLPRSFAERRDEWCRENDLFGAWIMESIEVDPGSKNTQGHTNKSVYQNYSQWCEANGCTPLGPRNFIAEMKARGYKIHELDVGRIWVGVSLKGEGL